MNRLAVLLLAFCLLPVIIPAGAAEMEAVTPIDLRLNKPDPSNTLQIAAESDGGMLVVAAQDSSAAAKAEADYVCTGENDHQVIQQALNAVPSGGDVLLLEGTYRCAGTVAPRAHTVLKGQGEGATVLDFKPGHVRLGDQHTALSNLTITGSGYVYILQSHIRLKNVTVSKVDNTFMGAFMIYASSRVIEDVEFTGCRAIDVNRWGFVHNGEGSPNRVKNIRYIDCQAINCGRSGQYRGGWDVGFNIAEVTD
ncbi:MAG: hypothetical protein PHV57_07980, partial [Methanomicrobiaceae archaeon]|nr:hypothetical protein [Methanomicrobiaceae archaeon]